MDGLGFFRTREHIVVYSKECTLRPLCMFRLLEDRDANITFHFFVIVGLDHHNHFRKIILNRS